MFTRVAMQKLNELLQRKGFLTAIAVKADEVTISFTDRICTISSFGNVKWFERPQN